MVGNLYGRKWLVISFFSAISFFFIYFIYFLATQSVDETYARIFKPAPERPRVTDFSNDSDFFLLKDQPITVGKIQMTYRGIVSGIVVLDIILVELDPDYTYLRQMSVQRAKQGFQILNRKFKALSVGKNLLRINMGGL